MPTRVLHKLFSKTLLTGLILALLVGQSLAAAHHHEADHGAEAECQLCLYAQQLDATDLAGGSATPARYSAGFIATGATGRLPGPVAVGYQSRAPPVNS